MKQVAADRAHTKSAMHAVPRSGSCPLPRAAGQVVGQLKNLEKTAAVVERGVRECLEATAVLNELNTTATV